MQTRQEARLCGQARYYRHWQVEEVHSGDHEQVPDIRVAGDFAERKHQPAVFGRRQASVDRQEVARIC